MVPAEPQGRPSPSCLAGWDKGPSCRGEQGAPQLAVVSMWACSAPFSPERRWALEVPLLGASPGSRPLAHDLQQAFISVSRLHQLWREDAKGPRAAQLSELLAFVEADGGGARAVRLASAAPARTPGLGPEREISLAAHWACNKLPQSEWPFTTPVYSLEFWSSKSAIASTGLESWRWQGWTPSGALGRIPFLAFSSFLSCIPHSSWLSSLFLHLQRPQLASGFYCPIAAAFCDQIPLGLHLLWMLVMASGPSGESRRRCHLGILHLQSLLR